jgi:hypothetical protein
VTFSADQITLVNPRFCATGVSEQHLEMFDVSFIVNFTCGAGSQTQHGCTWHFAAWWLILSA